MDTVRHFLGSIGMPHLPFELWWLHRRRFEVMTDWNRRHRAFFVHIPKTAGTSLYDALGMSPLPYTHAPARVLQRLYPEEYRTFRTFSVIRDPFDRFVSTFEFLRSGVTWPEQKAWAEQMIGTLSFRDFVLQLGRDRGYRNRVMSYNFFFSQHYFLSDRSGRIIVDELLRFEHLAEDFAALATTLGIEGRLGHARASTRDQGTGRYFDGDTRDIIAGLYARDFSL